MSVSGKNQLTSWQARLKEIDEASFTIKEKQKDAQHRVNSFAELLKKKVAKRGKNG